MININASANFLHAPETDTSFAIREKIINEKSLREAGGIGWSILSKIGVRYPGPEQFDLQDCLREQEITETWQKLESGKKVWWEGGDGYGKTTFMGEFKTFIEAENLNRSSENKIQIIDLGVLTHGNIADLKFYREQITYFSSDGIKFAPNILYVVDSVDYLWEQTQGRDLSALTSARIEVFKLAIKSPFKVLMTAHDKDSKNKVVDSPAKIRCGNILSSNHVDINKLSPLYPPDKINRLLKRVGIPNQIADNLTSSLFYPIRHHGVMSNYVLGGPETYSIGHLVSWIDYKIKFGEDFDQITEDIKQVLIARNYVRIRDWATIGF